AKKSIARSSSKPSAKRTPAMPALKSKPASRSGRALKKASKAAAPKGAKSPTHKPWTEAEVREAFSRFRQANPQPKGERDHLNPFTLLVAVVLSAQATDAGVNGATRAPFQIA